LPKHRLYDCTIDLQDGAQPPFGPIYNLSQNELSALKDCIKENLAKNFKFIRHLKYFVGAPIFFEKKKGRIFANVRRLSWLEQDNGEKSLSIALIYGLLDQLDQAKIYTKINL
jgi:hypothetical protein